MAWATETDAGWLFPASPFLQLNLPSILLQSCFEQKGSWNIGNFRQNWAAWEATLVPGLALLSSQLLAGSKGSNVSSYREVSHQVQV